ncbi:hypothetical protein R1sor_002944 [Riccia sorocarpa]|uniref:Carbohydrate binding module family 25 domain-containing protein n=1 Tax=Riccia sorocarpa TaxID=122646 RepID=A0ABD3H3A7_9MARC
MHPSQAAATGSLIPTAFVDCSRYGVNDLDSAAATVAVRAGDSSRHTALASCSGRGTARASSSWSSENYGGGGLRQGGSGCSGNFSSSRTDGRGRTNGRHGKLVKVFVSLQRGADPREQDRETTVREIAELAGSMVSLKRLIGSGYRAIGPEMRERVDRLYDRVMIIQESASRAVTNQLVATLRALQREHGSLENIIRLAMEAEPSLANLDSEDGISNPADDSTLGQEDLKPKASVFHSLIRQSEVEPLPKPPASNYVMTAPASQGSPLAAFRAEIERRVMKQLAEKRLGTPVKPSTDIGTDKPLLPTEALSQAPEKRQIIEEKKLEDNSYQGDSLDSVDSRQDKSSYESGILSRSPKISVGSVMNTIETESLKRSMSTIREELIGLKNVRLRADMAESKIHQLEVDLAKSIPLDLHEQMVKNIRTSLTDARVKILKVTNEVKEKESMLEAVKQSMLAEQEKLTRRVRELTGDLARRVSREEMEEAVAYAVGEVEMELERVHKRAVGLSIELERKEHLLQQQQEEWKVLKESLETELHSVRERLDKVNKLRTAERAQLIEAQQKVKALEIEITRLQTSEEEEKKLRIKSRKETLATVRVLISHMVQSQRARAKSEEQAVSLVKEVEKLQEENKTLELVKRAAEEKAELAEAEVQGMKSSFASVGKEVENLHATLGSRKRTVALEKFFAAMAQLIRKEDEKMKFPPYKFLQTESSGRLTEELDVMSNSGGDAGLSKTQEIKNLVTLQYESSWEWAYLHFKADDSGWTDVPGVLMQNCGNEDSHLKTLIIQASSVEFVLNDGKHSWDSAPGGGNYFIHESGNYYLSNGHLRKID